MDLNILPGRHQQALMLQEKAANAEERRAYRQFARDHFGLRISDMSEDTARGGPHIGPARAGSEAE